MNTQEAKSLPYIWKYIKGPDINLTCKTIEKRILKDDL